MQLHSTTSPSTVTALEVVRGAKRKPRTGIRSTPVGNESHLLDAEDESRDLEKEGKLTLIQET
jgi:hypothetical protein